MTKASAYMTRSAALKLERKFKLERRAMEILDLVVAEWRTDPMSVQCFDLRIVKEAKSLMRELKDINREIAPWESEAGGE